MTPTFAFILAQTAAPAATSSTTAPASTAAPQYDPNAAGPPSFMMPMMMVATFGLVYFAFLRPQSQAKKKQEEMLKSAKTGDRVITSSGIHGVITNVKDSTAIVKVADNVKLEIQKTHLEKIIRADETGAEKTVSSKS